MLGRNQSEIRKQAVLGVLTMRKVSMICGLVICMCLAAAAQKNQLSADLGVKLSPSVGSTGGFNFSTSPSNAFAFEVNYARPIKALPMASVQMRFPYVI